MRGAIHPLPHTSSWRIASLSRGYFFVAWYEVKNRDPAGTEFRGILYSMTSTSTVYSTVSFVTVRNSCYALVTTVRFM
jgi:hypothetical protein